MRNRKEKPFDLQEAMKDTANITPDDIQQFVAGMEFPATKQQVVEYVSDGNAPQEVIDAVELLTDRTYVGPTDLTKEISLIFP